MKKTTLFAIVLVVLGAGVGGFSLSDRFETKHNITTFALKDSAGKKHELSDFQGKVILLHFWASWCPPCIDEIPQWLKLARRFGTDGSSPEAGVQFIAISLDENWDKAHQILKDSDLPTSVISLLDPSLKVAEDFGSYQYPETYLLGKDGSVVTKWVGAQNWENPRLIELLEKLNQ